MPSTSIALLPGAMIEATGVPQVQPSTLRVASWSAPGRTPASRNRSGNETPMKFDVEMYGPPTSFDTQTSVMVFSTSGRRSRSS